jgi:hypothetical protein
MYRSISGFGTLGFSCKEVGRARGWGRRPYRGSEHARAAAKQF